MRNQKIRLPSRQDETITFDGNTIYEISPGFAYCLRDRGYMLTKYRLEGQSANRSSLVDALRGVSILLVMLFHFDMYYHLRTSDLARSLGLGHVVTLITRNGYFGVTMFFVISGFLITSTSLRRYGRLRDIRPLNFYWFRFSRIAPCLALVLGTLVALHFSGNPYFTLNTKDYSVLTAVVHVLTFRFNALLVHFGWNINQWNVLWSLSIEETFYLFFPLVCFLIRDTRLIAGLCIGVFLAGPFARFAAGPMGQIYGYFSCFDQIALGCLTAICFPRTRQWFKSSPYAIFIPIAGALMVVGAYFWGGWQEKIVFAPSLIAIGTALMLLGSECALPRLLRYLSAGAPLLASFGQRSYEIYLFHLIVIEFMWIVSADLKMNTGVYSPVWLFAFLCVAYGVAYLIFRFWSEPMNRSIRQALKPAASLKAAARAEFADASGSPKQVETTTVSG
jgi:peptidoglycan/LPS O-acetylase OafA/YrhL